MRPSLAKIMERVSMELACTLAIAPLATQETNARRVIDDLFKSRLSLKMSLCMQISMNANRFLATTAERA